MKAIHGWEGEVAGIAGDLGVTSEAIMLAFRKYDARVAAGEFVMPPYGIDDDLEEERIQLIVQHVLMNCERQKRGAKAKPKRHRRTKEAMRKAKARAEGRVKPRPRKGPPTIQARIAATERSLATRRATLARLKAEPNWQLRAEVRRCEVGIERAEKSLATWKARLLAADR